MATLTKKMTDKAIALTLLKNQLQALKFPTEDAHNFTDKAGLERGNFSDKRLDKLEAQWAKGIERSIKVFSSYLDKQ